MNKIPYVVLKFLLTPFYLLKFHPTINGKENIPKEGPIIFCGNHMHVMDQCNILISTKRIIRYLAKDEYFKGKKAWFFKSVGCISVNRSIHDEDAKNQAIQILMDGGSVGLFPEGTRNEITCKADKLETLYNMVKDDYTKEELIKLIKPRSFKYTQIELLMKLEEQKRITKDELKKYVLDPDNSLKKLLKEKKIKMSEYDESLLIPLKYGAVSFANKTNAKIIPFGVSGEYTGKKGNLTCNIGKPIDVSGMSLEEANTILSKSIIKLMKNNK